MLQKQLESDRLPWDKVVGYASDGENLMQGTTNFVLTRLQEKAPGLFVLKCFCHSFHLVANYACAKLSNSAEELVHDIYNYFKSSPNRQDSLVEFQHFCNTEPNKILKSCQTRWIS